MREPAVGEAASQDASADSWLAAAWRLAPLEGSRIKSEFDPWDEMMAGDSVRPHWERFFEGASAVGPRGISERWAQAERILHENGVTYNVYGDPRGVERPWPADPIPMLLGADEWSRIEAAIIQRATLVSAILRDAYGPQKLLKDRKLPAALVLGNPHFLRALHGIRLPLDRHLHIFAADIARSPDGSWWVLADRTQGASGAGYALENRSLMLRILPELVQRCRIRSLQPYFDTYLQSLIDTAPRNKDNPRVVLLTPGPYNETYFEHAYLARYLGITLVEGGDLTVRNDQVFLKTLSGLLPVDVILRRQDDSFCDPMELRDDSVLGIPGLVRAVRAGNVAMANPLGSGLTDSPAMCAFLPGLCRHILGEELKMPSVATWWCGQDLPFHSVRDQIGRLVIKPAFPALRAAPVFGAQLNSVERAALLERVGRDPDNYVAQEMVDLSASPVWGDTGLAKRRMVMRVYAVASKDGFVVLPGALTRVASTADSFVVSMQHGGGSKDTWILSEPHSQETIAPAIRTSNIRVASSRATFDLPSRVADDLYWLGRYCERLEFGARIMRSLLDDLFEDRVPEDSPKIRLLAGVLYGMNYLSKRPSTKAAALEADLLATVRDSQRADGLAWMVDRIRSLAWVLRERISPDSWRVLHGLHLRFEEASATGPVPMAAALDLMIETIVMLSAFSGLVLESMTRGVGWQILNMGRRIERAIQSAHLLQFGTRFAPEDESQCVEAILEIAESSITYRSRYLAALQVDLMLDLLLADEINPRSIAYQLRWLADQPVMPGPDEVQLVRRIPLEVLDRIARTSMTSLIERDEDGDYYALETFLLGLVAGFNELSETVTRHYLTHAAPMRAMTN